MSIRAEHDYLTSEIDDCPDCQELVDGGFIEACDECDFVGSAEADYPGWQLQADGRLLCLVCADKESKQQSITVNPTRCESQLSS